MNSKFTYGNIVCVQNDSCDSGRVANYNDADEGYYEGHYMMVISQCSSKGVEMYALKDLMENKVAGIWKAEALTLISTLKIGDTVCVKNECSSKPGIIFAPPMENIGGQIFHIKDYLQTTEDKVFYYVEENQWIWDKDWLEPVNCIRINDDALSNILSFVEE